MTDEVIIQYRKNGPYIVKGPAKLVDYEGNEYLITGTVALCRCGGSGNKPFCDGTHRRNGFQAEETLAGRTSQTRPTT